MASPLSLRVLASKPKLFLGRRVVPSAPTRWIASAARPKWITGVGVGTVCHDDYLSSVELKLGALLDVRYAPTTFPADGTATWKTFPLPRTQLISRFPT